MTQLNQNTTDLQSILDAVNALPDAGSGIEIDVTLNDDETQNLLITDEKGEVDIDAEKNISSVTYNGVEVPLGAGAPAIFGDGSDGVGLFTANTMWNAETEDTGMIVKNFESLTISEGVTVSAGNRNCGMIIRVKGDCTIAGTLVNKLAPKSILDSDNVNFSNYPGSMLASVAGNGGAGGDGSNGSYTGGSGGAGQSGRFYGGGYSGGGGGGNGSSGRGGKGGASTGINTSVENIFVGGVPKTTSGVAGSYGGGGSGGGFQITSIILGGAGGSGAGGNGAFNNSGGGGGAGNYGGGVIILLVAGNLTITGGIDCSGSVGGAGGNAHAGNQSDTGGGGGGGGGGGRIFICHKGEYSCTGVLNVNGGAGGGGGSAKNGASKTGFAGSIGTTAVKTYEQYMEEDMA